MTIALRALTALGLTGSLAATIAAQGPTYNTQPPTGTGSTQLRDVALGDIDHDGYLDIVTASENMNRVSLMLTGGNTRQFDVGSKPYAVALGDVDRDGNLDIVTANYGSNTVTVLMGTGTEFVGAVTDFAAGSKPCALALGDISGDGLTDIAVANEGTDGFSILNGLGSGSFGAPTAYALGNGLGYHAQSIALGDMNGDNFLDIVVTASPLLSGPPVGNLDRACVILNSGTGVPSAMYSAALDFGPRGLAIGDVNGDFVPDVVTANMLGNVAVLPGIGGGILGNASYYSAGVGCYGVAIGDLSGDGILDIVTSNFGYYPNVGSTVSILIGTGAGSFATAYPVTVGSEPMALALGDMDNSGRLDIVTANYSSNDVTTLTNNTNNFNPTFAPYGTGTSGCSGRLGLDANSLPTSGNANFAVIGANAPKNSLGLLLYSDNWDFVGHDTFGLNILMHVAVNPSLTGVNAYSGPSGEIFAPAPIPGNPVLVGKFFFFQTAWVEPINLRCTPGTIGLETSRGLKVKIQP